MNLLEDIINSMEVSERLKTALRKMGNHQSESDHLPDGNCPECRKIIIDAIKEESVEVKNEPLP